MNEPLRKHHSGGGFRAQADGFRCASVPSSRGAWIPPGVCHLRKGTEKAGNLGCHLTDPRTVSKCCGISLMIEEKDVEAVEKCASDHGIEILQIVAVEKDLNPRRDRYC